MIDPTSSATNPSPSKISRILTSLKYVIRPASTIRNSITYERPFDEYPRFAFYDTLVGLTRIGRVYLENQLYPDACCVRCTSTGPHIYSGCSCTKTSHRLCKTCSNKADYTTATEAECGWEGRYAIYYVDPRTGQAEQTNAFSRDQKL
jgi:hypothetical protein